jgi:pyridoxine/pyridoxamine 5'-phosphate oxidase
VIALPERMRALIAAHETMVLATAGADGQPEAAAVFFALEDGPPPALICTLLSRSKKLAQIRANPRVGFFIGPPRPTRWLQGSGSVRIIEDEPARGEHIRRLVAGAPGAAVFVERVPVTPIVIVVQELKLTDLTGPQPSVETVRFT